jgi:hypothetical protein
MGWQHKRNRLMVRIQEEQEGVVHNPIPALIHLLDGVASEPQPQAAGVWIFPVFVAHLLPIRSEPHQILDFGTTDLPSMEKLTASQDRMLVKHLDQAPGKG